MKQIELSSGFKCEIDEQVLDDMELFDALVECDKGNQLMLPFIVTKILGNSKKAFYDFYRENGRVPMTKAYTAMTEIITALGTKK